MQIADRYRDSSPYLVYELMNEPHGIGIEVWNGIVARLFEKVRAIDRRHYIIVGGADWNSTAAMKQLPDFKDDKVIYTFHFYDPHAFTHQGAPWCHMERVRGLPFPYDEEKMPPLPDDPTDIEKKCFEEYPRTGTIEAIESFFDEYVDFSIARNAPVFCGEFGCNCFAVGKEERVKWYAIVTKLLDERGIARTSWDYYGGFGIFEMDFGRPREKGRRIMPEFPQQLNRELVEAMGFAAPK
jgi:endoglucanase